MPLSICRRNCVLILVLILELCLFLPVYLYLYLPVYLPDSLERNNFPLRSGKGETWEGGIRATGLAAGWGLDEVAGTRSEKMHHGKLHIYLSICLSGTVSFLLPFTMGRASLALSFSFHTDCPPRTLPSAGTSVRLVQDVPRRGSCWGRRSSGPSAQNGLRRDTLLVW